MFYSLHFILRFLTSQSEVLCYSLVDFLVDIVFILILWLSFENPNNKNVHYKDENGRHEEVIVCVFFDMAVEVVVLVIVTNEAWHVRVQAHEWLVLEACANCSWYVFASKVSSVGLVVDWNSRMGVNLLQVLPLSILFQDSVFWLVVTWNIKRVVDAFFNFLIWDL